MTPSHPSPPDSKGVIENQVGHVPSEPGSREPSPEEGLGPSGVDPSRIVPWPEDGGPLSFEEICRPVTHAIRFAYDLTRRDKRRNIPWRGPEIIGRVLASSPTITERLKAHRLAYSEEDQGRDALEEIVSGAIQLGIEQGRRIAKSDEEPLLDKVCGATFTVTIGHDRTHVHTQSGFMADPITCLSKAIQALVDEMARVQRCPRQKALARGPKASPGRPGHDD